MAGAGAVRPSSLLALSRTGEFTLIEDLASDKVIPPYAILSHTWGADDKEVTFDDLTNSAGKHKLGYKKIRFYEEQVVRDGLEYFWINTYYINKTNKAELLLAINSIFRWYRNATRYYVYLSDISITNPTSNMKNKLTEYIPLPFNWAKREGIGIPKTALQGIPLSRFSVKDRFYWIGSRQIKLKEDKAYLLLGIFDINIPLCYGKGIASAFKRLEEEINKLSSYIRDLRLTDPCDDKKCLEETKGGLLEDSYRWILENSDFQRWRDDEQSRLLWIKGAPGKGKTMLLCGIINELNKLMTKTSQLAYFFCQATDSRINNATAVLRGLLYLLVNQQPSLVSYIRKKYDYAGKALFEDTNVWVALSEIFINILQDLSLNSTYLIIDALDECVADLRKLLDLIVQTSSASPRTKWIVLSRNWPDVEERLERARDKVRLSLELNAQPVSTAVEVFIQHKVLQLVERKKRHVIKKLNAFPPGLDLLYDRMLQQISTLEDADLCKRILALVTIVYQPITLQELVTLVAELEDMADDTGLIREIIGLSKDFLFAIAFDDIFPFGKEEVHRTVFSRSLKVMARSLHRDIYCLAELGYPSEKIKQPTPNPLAALCYSCIYWIDHLYDSNSSCPSNDIEEFLSTKYVYWLEALSLCRSMSKGVVSVAKLSTLVQKKANSSFLVELVQDAYRFIMYHKVAIENSPLQTYASALLFSPKRSLIKSLFEREKPSWVKIVPPITDSWSLCLQTLEGHSEAVGFVALSSDSKWLVSSSYDKTIKIWDPISGNCSQTLKGHDDLVSSAVFSPDSKTLASASYDNTIKIWDPVNSICLQTLEGHNGWVNSVAFSHDSRWLASASHDKTIRIWNTLDWVCLKILMGHNGTISFVAFSHDSKRLVSASRDKTVKVWDLISGNYSQTLIGHSDLINAVTFSLDSKSLASASNDKTIKIWDPINGICLQTLEGHNGWVNSVAFSHDSKWLASASDDKTIKIWDSESGTCSWTLQGHSGAVSSVAFLPESNRLISGSYDNTVKIWDITGNTRLQNPQGHSDSVSVVTFSPGMRWLASASRDKTIKIWDMTSGNCSQTLEGHNDLISSVVFSPDLKSLASASNDKMIKIWDPVNSICLQTLKGHNSWVYSVTFSHDSKRLASSSYDKTIKIWDPISGNCSQTLKGHDDLVSSAVFSPDSKTLASASYDNTIKIWDPVNGICLQTLEGHNGWVYSVAFSHDSKQLASASNDNTIRIWDLRSIDCLYMLDIGKPLSNISFSTCDSFLHTEIGSIAISSSLDSSTASGTELQDPAYQGIALSLDRIWITLNSKTLLRLPPQYRPSCLALSGNTIGVGVGSGEVWVFQFEV
ncbi:WD40 repeat-like protein [Lojkania enalia]|uniref:Mitochondrial division protein 1 n=1 Tax=Lojkania enalia TaxID=147567 RepID=A0A9P4JWC6_9PLEO|nr:WD40 repeat-like protein [Didymosphaeria enalia]